MTPNAYMIVTLTPTYVLLYNTDLVGEAEAPLGWDAALDQKWKGKTGHWMRAALFVNLSAAIGAQGARGMVDRLTLLKPRLFDGLYPLSQAVGSGEISLAITAYDSALRIVEKGVPVKMISLNPTPMGLICGSTLKYGNNPNTGRLFLAWMATSAGAVTFEKLTKRGNLQGGEEHRALKLEDQLSCLS